MTSITALRAGLVLLGTALAMTVVVAAPAPLPESYALAGAPAGAEEPVPLKAGVFLIANPALGDPNFRHSVVLLTAHGDDGSMGVIINRRTDLPLAKAVPDVRSLAGSDQPIYFGGPVGTQFVVLLIRSKRPVGASVPVTDGIYFSASMSTLQKVLKAKKPRPAIKAYLGYAGWAPGQLESEVRSGDWYLFRADAATVFESDPDTLWQRLMRLAGGRWTRRYDGASSVVWLRWRAGSAGLDATGLRGSANGRRVRVAVSRLRALRN